MLARSPTRPWPRSARARRRRSPSTACSPTWSRSASSPRRWSRRWRGSAIEGRPVLIARAAEARDVLPDALRERGADVDVVALYETVARESRPRGGRGRRHGRLRHLHLLLHRPQPRSRPSATVSPTGARIVSIGPVTSETAREAGLDGPRRGRAARHRGTGRGAARRRARAACRWPARSPSSPTIARTDEFAGVCRAVIARIAPEARVIDLTHGIPALRRRATVRRCWRARSPTRRRGSISRWSIRGSARRGGRSRSGSPRATGSWSGPTTACSRSRSSASAAPGRRSTSPPLRSGSSRSRPPFTAATCSPPSPPTWRSERHPRSSASRSTPPSSPGSSDRPR